MWNAHFPVSRQAESNQVCQCVKIAWPFFSAAVVGIKTLEEYSLYMCSEQQTEETRREILYLPHFLIVLCTPSTRLLPCCCCSSIVNVNIQAKRKKKMFKNSKHKKCQEMRLSGWVYVILCSQLLCINFEKKTGKLSMTWEKSLRELVTRSGETHSCGFFCTSMEERHRQRQQTRWLPPPSCDQQWLQEATPAIQQQHWENCRQIKNLHRVIFNVCGVSMVCKKCDMKWIIV